jgi:hypothetical protein
VRVGSREHRDLFCRTFIGTHRPFEPKELAWPQLEAHHVELLSAFPFWAFALSMEQEAARMITTFSRTIEDPLIRKAVELQAFEEERHGRLLRAMFERYGIEVASVPLLTKPVGREDFLVFGFGECTDSVIGFGGFALAREKQVFPPGLLAIFEEVLYEEARHIVFFINWWHYEEAVAGRANLLGRLVRALQYSVRAVMHTAQGAQGAAVAGHSLDLTGGSSQAILEGVSPQMFLEVALAENRKMMERLDQRLLRPRIVPTLATAALLVLRMLPPRKQPSAKVLKVA